MLFYFLPEGRKNITPTFVLNVILFLPGGLAKGLFFFEGEGLYGRDMWVHLRLDLYGAFFTDVYGCSSSLDLFTEMMIKQS